MGSAMTRAPMAWVDSAQARHRVARCDRHKPGANTTCFCRLTVVWSLACSPGLAAAAVGQRAGVFFPVFAATGKHHAKDGEENQACPYVCALQNSLRQFACGRARVLVVMPAVIADHQPR